MERNTERDGKKERITGKGLLEENEQREINKQSSNLLFKESKRCSSVRSMRRNKKRKEGRSKIKQQKEKK